MNFKKNFLSRIARRKDSVPAESEDEYEIPPPTAIEPGASDSPRDAGQSDYDSHVELELLASDEPPRSESASGADAEESGRHVAAEASAALVPDESPDDSEPPREVEAHREYGLEMEVLAASESDESPAAPKPSLDSNETASGVAESDVEALESVRAILEEGETETIGDAAPEFEEASDAAESAAEAAVSELEVPQVSEPEAVRVAADSPLKRTNETSEPHLTENEFLPLVRDARGDWRPGKGFSRSELHEAGLGLAEAARLRIRVDKRRRNAHPMNVAALEKAKSGV